MHRPWPRLPPPAAGGGGRVRRPGRGRQPEQRAALGGRRRAAAFALVRPGRDVRKLIELSCLGEFETCKALSNLVSPATCARATPRAACPRWSPAGGRPHASPGRWGGSPSASWWWRRRGGRLARVRRRPGPSRSPARSFADPAAQRLVSQAQRARIGAALEVFRLEHGVLPEQLSELVQEGLSPRATCASRGGIRTTTDAWLVGSTSCPCASFADGAFRR